MERIGRRGDAKAANQNESQALARAGDEHGLRADAQGPQPQAAAPVAVDDNFTIERGPIEDDGTTTVGEDYYVLVDVFANDFDPDGDSFQFDGFGPIETMQGINGVVSGFDGPGQIRVYTREDGYVGPGQFQYWIKDSQGNRDLATVHLTIVDPEPNQPPVANDDSASTAEDTPVTINVLANDTDPNTIHTLAITSVGSPVHGTASIISGNVRYTPPANYVGTDSFSYTVSDGRGGTDTATVTVTISAVNDAPDAVNDSVTVPEDLGGDIAVRANDIDIDGDTLTVTAVSVPGHGTATINPNGTIRYTPVDDYIGTDSFTYIVSDGHGGTDTATVNITVQARNDPPEPGNDSATVNEDSVVNINVRANDFDEEGAVLNITGLGTPGHGSVAIGPNGTIQYTPQANFNGTDSFTYTVSDGNSTGTATVTVTVTPVNDAPTAAADAATTDEDVPFAINVLANDSDIDGDPVLSVSAVGAPQHGSATINPNGTIQYTPNANYNGADSFTYTLSDGHGGTNTGQVTLTINPVNDAPSPAADARLINENTIANIAVLANDIDIDGIDILTVSAVGTAAHGATAINPDGTVRYAPDADWFGVDSFTYTVADGAGGFANATVTVTVNNIPEARYNRALTREEQAVTLNVVANDRELDGDTLSVSAVGAAAHGTVSFAGGSVTYTPVLDFFGQDHFTYTVADGRGGFDTETVTVTVEEVVDDGELLVNPAAATGRQDETTIAALAHGGWVVIYHQYTGADIYARRFGADGLPIGEAFKVNKADTGSSDDGENDATVAGLADGGFVVVYTSEDFDGTATAVAARRYDANGVAMGDEFLVGPSMTAARDSPSIGALTDGGFVVAYGEGQTLAVQRYNADGTAHGTREIISTGYSYGAPAVAGLAGGGYVVTEQGYFDAGEAGYGILAHVFDANGARVAGPFSMTQTNSFSESRSAITGLPGGGWVAVWEVESDGSGAGIYARRYNADGSAAGPSFLVNSVTAYSQYRPSVAAFPDGRFIIDWTSQGEDGDSSNLANVYARIFAADGTPLGDPFRINETISGSQSFQGYNGSGTPHNPTVAVLADGTVAFSWWGNGEGASDGTFTRRFTADSLIQGTANADTLTASKGQDVVQGLGGNDILSGLLGDDQLSGGDGDDLLSGGPGADSLDGGNGIDTASYATAPTGVAVSLALTGAQDTLGAGTDTLAGIENLIGSAWEDALTGNAGANVLTGGGEADLLDGGAGADRFVYLYASDSTAGARDRILNFQSGVDKIDLRATGATAVAWTEVTDASGTWKLVTVQTPGGEMAIRVDGALALADFLLPGGGAIVGTSGPDSLPGTAGDDVIQGLAGDDTLNGGAGADRMEGGAGNDLYFVDNIGDRVVEAAGEGNDRIFASLSYTLAAGVSIETLGTTNNAGTAAINLTGNELANTLYGNDGANILNGGGGADTMAGRLGDDYYYVDNAGDRVIEGNGEGTDRVFASVSYTLAAGASVETLSTASNAGTAAINLTGNELANTLFGNDGANSLDGKGGADTLAGLLGDDYYYVDNVADRVIEAAGGGTDRVFAAVSYTLAAGAAVEVLSTSFNAGTNAINLTGNELANTIFGNDGANTLDGKAGADTLAGLLGDDFYYVDNAGDRVIESAAGGNDRVFASASYALGAGVSVEMLTTSSNAGTGAINLTGNELANTIFGNNGANVLDGKAGADTLVGSAGADTFAFTTALGGGNVDRLADFQAGTDKVALDDAVFAGIGPLGALDANAFATGAAAADASDRIVYNAATGQLFYDADGNGAIAAVQFATVAAGLGLTAVDFIVI